MVSMPHFSVTMLIATLTLLMQPGFVSAALPPVIEGDLTILVAHPSRTLDPAFAMTLGERQASSMIAEALFSTDGRQVKGLSVLKWKIENEAQSLHIWLKPGLTFHDGSQLAADDVRASFERLLSPKTGSRRWWRLSPIKGAKSLHQGKSPSLEGFERISPLEFILHVNANANEFIHWLADPVTAILPARYAKRSSSLVKPVGSGPFALESLIDGQVVLKAFEGHHAGRPYLSSIRLKPVEDAEAEKLALANARTVSIAGRIDTPKQGRRDFSPLGTEVILRSNPARFSGSEKYISRMWRLLIDCRRMVRLFERRHIASFESEDSRPRPIPIRGPDLKFNAYLETMSKAAGRSCEGFKPDPEAALDLYKKLAKNERLVIRVRNDIPELKLIAQRIALTSADKGIRLRVKAIEPSDWSDESGSTDWDFELVQTPAFSLPEEKNHLPKQSEVILYRLPSAALWKNRQFDSVHFSVWGTLDLGHLSRRLP